MQARIILRLWCIVYYTSFKKLDGQPSYCLKKKKKWQITVVLVKLSYIQVFCIFRSDSIAVPLYIFQTNFFKFKIFLMQASKGNFCKMRTTGLGQSTGQYEIIVNTSNFQSLFRRLVKEEYLSLMIIL